MEGADRERVEAHLVDCDACRAEAVAVGRLLDASDGGRPGARWLRWTLPTAAAAAAVAGILFLAPGVEEGGDPTGPVLRTDEAETPTLEAVSPTGPVLAPDSVIFVWRRTGEDVTYRITVMNEVGEALWRSSVEDTSAVLPENVALEAGEQYYWYVDGLLELGRTATSGIQEFTISR